MRITVRVPATAANLGPGFDCFGLALDLCNEVTLDTETEPGVTWAGEGADELPTDGTDMVTAAIAAVAAEGGGDLPTFGLHSVNRIPVERGLGSSCAAAVAGVLLGDRLLGLGMGREAVFAIATRLEGHPDNAAAAVHGGFTLAIPDADVVRLDPDPSLRPVALIPDVRLPTSTARSMLSRDVSRSDAVFNLAHAALAVVAIGRRPELLGVALRDRLHQEARLSAVPTVASTFRTLVGAGIPVAVSGAGPSLIAFPSDATPIPDLGEGWRVLAVRPSAAGAELEEAS
jgi:homoserine kinase